MPVYKDPEVVQYQRFYDPIPSVVDRRGNMCSREEALTKMCSQLHSLCIVEKCMHWEWINAAWDVKHVRCPMEVFMTVEMENLEQLGYILYDKSLRDGSKEVDVRMIKRNTDYGMCCLT